MKLLAIISTLIFGWFFLSSNLNGQQYFGQNQFCDHEDCGLEAEDIDKFTFIPPPEGFEFGGARDATISVTYNGFSTNAQNAFQYAVDIWASYLESSVPITINANWASIGGSTLGFAGANDYEINFSGAPTSNVWYPAALANKLAGFDLNPGTSDISCTFNSNTNWYYGTDGNTPSGQYDLVSVVLHELGHGLGCIGGSSYNNGTGTYGFSGTPVIWDTFIENNSNVDLSTFSSPSTSLGSQLTSNNLYWDGTNGVDGLNGTRPRIYAPSNWNGGSSYSHLNEGSYPSGNANSLMTPFIGSAEAIHDPGPAMLGMFQDMGWEIFPECSITDVSVVSSTPCNGTTGEFDLTISISYENPPTEGFILINGEVFNILTSPQEFTFTYPANSQLINYSILFSDDQACTYNTGNIFSAPPPCCAQLRFTDVNTDTKQFTIENFGTCTEDLTAYRLCSENNYFLFNNLTLISGNMNLASGSSATFEWGSWNPSLTGADLALYIPFADFNNPIDMLDFVQWGSAGNGREAIADLAGFWTAGDFITDSSPFEFSGGANDRGVSFWSGSPPPTPCAITNLALGNGTGCTVSDLSFSQEVIIIYENAPLTGSINLNGEVFPILSSPQTYNLTGMASDGMNVDVTAFFTDEATCTLSETALFTAPESCACAFDYNSNGFVAIDDLTVLLADFGCASDCERDLSGDGAITIDDITLFLQNFGSLCIP